MKELGNIRYTLNKVWQDLDIDNLPDRFFTRDDIEIEWLRLKHDNAVYDIWEIANEARHIMIGNIQKYSTKYRYRLKPLESIRITRDIVKKYNIPVTEEIFEIPKEQQERNCGILDNRFVIDGRKVEIID